MAEVHRTRIWLHQFAFAGLCCLIMFAQLLPIDSRPEVWAAPDLMLAVAIVWVARQPDYAPFMTIALLFLLADLLFQRPPGLWAALVLIATEVIRARNASIRNMPLMLEWGLALTAIVGVTLAYRIVLTVVMIPQPPLGMSLIQMLMTIAAYPIVVAIAHFAFGVTRAAPGAVDGLGHRL